MPKNHYQDNRRILNVNYQQQQELVRFLYDRFVLGNLFTLILAGIVSILVYVELSIQGKAHYVLTWYALLILISFIRLKIKHKFDEINQDDAFPIRKWRNIFYVGVLFTGSILGMGAALIMSDMSIGVQLILYCCLLGMGAGSIPFLSTSMLIYMSYLACIVLPVVIWLLVQEETIFAVLAAMLIFMMLAYSMSVRRMNSMLMSALYYRFDNEHLIHDLQHLLGVVTRYNKELDKITLTDELTGILNFRAFRVRLEQACSEMRKLELPVSIILINIDYFLEFNMHYGGQKGDQVLKDVAQLISTEVNQEDQLVARLNGAEFAVLLPAVSCENAKIKIKRIIDRLKKLAIKHEKSRVSNIITFSIGLSSQMYLDRNSSRLLLDQANSVLGIAKRRGRNHLEIAQL